VRETVAHDVMHSIFKGLLVVSNSQMKTWAYQEEYLRLAI